MPGISEALVERVARIFRPLHWDFYASEGQRATKQDVLTILTAARYGELVEALETLRTSHIEMRTFILQACDASNWDAGFKGDYFKGQDDARTEFQEIILEYIDCPAEKNARTLLASIKGEQP